MRVLLAGATGVIGRRLLPRLIADGHEVTGMTRSPEKADAVRAAGAEPTVCDALDADALHQAVSEARPEVVVNHLTDLPQEINLRRLKEAYAADHRVRAEAGPNLVQAAQASGARRIIAQSVAFIYAPEGGPAKSEDDPVYREAPPPFDKRVAATLAMERATTEAEGLEGLVLRFGFWYGPGTAFAADGYTAREVRRRRYPIVGQGTGVFSFAHVDDVASATVAALGRGRAGIYNVADDEPAPMREWLPLYAEALGAKPPRRIPRWLARIFTGPFVASMGNELRGASNAKARRELGWSPVYESWRRGFREALG